MNRFRLFPQRWRRLLWALSGLLSAVQAAAQTDCRELTTLTADALATFDFESGAEAWSSLPSGETYTLGEIEVVRQNVFEREYNALHRLANRYHRRTREQVVRNVLPMRQGMRQGEAVDGRLLAEAERILRSKVYLYDARVIPRRTCGDVLDVFVVTRDVWTLMPELSLIRTGSENDVGVGIYDTNLLGNGQYASVAYEQDQDRRGIAFAFADPNIRGSRWAVDLAVVDNDDGERTAATLERPFFALDARRAFSASTDNFTRDEGLYLLGDELWEYRADTRSARVSAGWSTGRVDGIVNRFRVGYAREDYRFDLPAGLAEAAPDLASPDREYGYPFVSFQRLEDDFETRVNLDRVQRTEDVELGARLYAEIGYSPDSGDGDRLVGRISYYDAAWLTARQLFTFNTYLDGYYDLDAGVSENLTVAGQIAYRYQHADAWSLLVRGSATAIEHPTLDRQLLLGGELGLRGYPNRYQSGDRRFLVTVEERYYSDVYPFRMFRLGGAVFLDVGRAWYQDDAPSWLPADFGEGGEFDLLANVGFGLRLESTRTRGDRILHLDVAFPLRDGPNVRGVEVTVTAKQTL